MARRITIQTVYSLPMMDVPAHNFMPIADIHALARKHGFCAAYALTPLPLADAWAELYTLRPPHTEGLCLDPTKEYPWASAILLLVRTYVPFETKARLSGYYIASNAGYHAANAICKELGTLGYRAERMEVPLPALVVQSNIGTLCKNGLLDIDGFGTRTALFTIATNACLPQSELPQPPSSCGTCTLCAHACPSGAIHAEHGLDSNGCLRTYMETAPMPEWVMERMPGLIGCEICQHACPRNNHAGQRFPTREECEAFAIPALLRGDIANTRILIGKNMCTGGRLQAQSAVLAAQMGRLDLIDDLQKLLGHPQAAVRHAAAWALNHMQLR